MKRDKDVANALLCNISTAVEGLIQVMPGIDCDVVQDRIKVINNAISDLQAEAENHG